MATPDIDLQLDRDLAKRVGLDAFLDRLDPQSGSIENADRSIMGQDRRVDDVFGDNTCRSPETSPGSVKPGSEAIATLAARPMPNSCMPPHQTGTPRAMQTSCTRLASRRPPTRLTLMLITRQAPRSRALRRRRPSSAKSRSAIPSRQ